MILSLVVKHHKVEIINLSWQNNQMIINLLNSEYIVIQNPNDILITHNKDQVIEPIRGKLIATCLITNNDITSVVLNASGYEVIATNSDGIIKSYEISDHPDNEDEEGSHHTIIKEAWTRNNHL